MLFWGFFMQILIYSIIVSVLGWVIMVIVFKALGENPADE